MYQLAKKQNYILNETQHIANNITFAAIIVKEQRYVVTDRYK
jgi:hypothetical protein